MRENKNSSLKSAEKINEDKRRQEDKTPLIDLATDIYEVTNVVEIDMAITDNSSIHNVSLLNSKAENLEENNLSKLNEKTKLFDLISHSKDLEQENKFDYSNSEINNINNAQENNLLCLEDLKCESDNFLSNKKNCALIKNNYKNNIATLTADKADTNAFVEPKSENKENEADKVSFKISIIDEEKINNDSSLDKPERQNKNNIQSTVNFSMGTLGNKNNMENQLKYIKQPFESTRNVNNTLTSSLQKNYPFKNAFKKESILKSDTINKNEKHFSYTKNKEKFPHSKTLKNLKSSNLTLTSSNNNNTVSKNNPENASTNHTMHKYEKTKTVQFFSREKDNKQLLSFRVSKTKNNLEVTNFSALESANNTLKNNLLNNIRYNIISHNNSVKKKNMFNTEIKKRGVLPSKNTAHKIIFNTTTEIIEEDEKEGKKNFSEDKLIFKNKKTNKNLKESVNKNIPQHANTLNAHILLTKRNSYLNANQNISNNNTITYNNNITINSKKKFDTYDHKRLNTKPSLPIFNTNRIFNKEKDKDKDKQVINFVKLDNHIISTNANLNNKKTKNKPSITRIPAANSRNENAITFNNTTNINSSYANNINNTVNNTINNYLLTNNLDNTKFSDKNLIGFNKYENIKRNDSKNKDPLKKQKIYSTNNVPINKLTLNASHKYLKNFFSNLNGNTIIENLNLSISNSNLKIAPNHIINESPIFNGSLKPQGEKNVHISIHSYDEEEEKKDIVYEAEKKSLRNYSINKEKEKEKEILDKPKKPTDHYRVQSGKKTFNKILSRPRSQYGFIDLKNQTEDDTETRQVLATENVNIENIKERHANTDNGNTSETDRSLLNNINNNNHYIQKNYYSLKHFEKYNTIGNSNPNAHYNINNNASGSGTATASTKISSIQQNNLFHKLGNPNNNNNTSFRNTLYICLNSNKKLQASNNNQNNKNNDHHNNEHYEKINHYNNQKVNFI